jgi:hypothetical protein
MLAKWVIWKTSLACLLLAGLGRSEAQTTITLLEKIRTAGAVHSVSPGVVEIVDADGKRQEYKIQGKGRPGLALTGVEGLLNFPAQVKIAGKLDTGALSRGTLVRFSGRVNRLGRTDGSVGELVLFDEGAETLGIEVVQQAASAAAYSDCTIRGEVYSFRDDRLVVTVPASDFVRNPRLSFRLDKQAVVRMESDDYRRAGQGDKVVLLAAARFSTGDVAIEQLEIDVSAERFAAKETADDGAGKYRQLSDEPSAPRELRSARFLLRTDISDRSARILLDKLETMIELVSLYYGRPSVGLIECYVVRDVSQWPPGGFPGAGARQDPGTRGRYAVRFPGQPDARNRLLVRRSWRGAARSGPRLLRPDLRQHRPDMVRRRDGRDGPILEKRPTGGRHQSGRDQLLETGRAQAVAGHCGRRPDYRRFVAGLRLAVGPVPSAGQ